MNHAFRIILITFIGTVFVAHAFAEVCVDCHKKTTPNIVADWKNSTHNKKGIKCSSCHGDKHLSNDDIAKAQLPTPDICARCHEKQFTQFRNGKHSLGWAAMKAMPLAHWQLMMLMEGVRGCVGCHKIGFKSEAETKELKKIGRVFGNASCDSCHTRHTFSVQEAQQPQACQTCHMGGDHPQWEMYASSKHGVRYLLKQSRVLPEDTTAPKCQTCHMQEGNHAVRAAWGFFGVKFPLARDRQWAEDQAVILQALGIFGPDGKPSESFEVIQAADVLRFTHEAWQKDRDKMLKTCNQCHSMNFAKGELAKGDEMIRSTDRLIAEAMLTIAGLYKDGLLKKDVPSVIEQKLLVMFKQRMLTFQGTFHTNPDYALWYGWSEMQRSLVEIKKLEAEMHENASKERMRIRAEMRQ